MGLITLHVLMIDGKIRIQALQGIFLLRFSPPFLSTSFNKAPHCMYAAPLNELDW